MKTLPRFVVFHALTPSTLANLNYGQDGTPKSTVLGVLRHRQSPQSKHRREIDADGPSSLETLGLERSNRSRFTFKKYVFQPLLAEGIAEDVALAVTQTIGELATGKNPAKKAKERNLSKARGEEIRERKLQDAKKQLEKAQDTVQEAEASGQGLRQANRSLEKAQKAVQQAQDAIDNAETTDAAKNDPTKLAEVVAVTPSVAQKLGEVALEAARNCKTASDAVEACKAAMAAFRKSLGEDNHNKVKLFYGIDTALRGMMGTSDILNRIDGASRIAHSFTVHEAQSTADDFVAVDELQKEFEPGHRGSGHMNQAFLASGLFYSYRVLEVHVFAQNLRNMGLEEDQIHEVIQKEVVRNLHGIAKPPPGAKAGSTAPYNRSSWVMVEIGDDQPCTAADAFWNPVPFEGDVLANTYDAVTKWFNDMEATYSPQFTRAMLATGAVEHLVIDVPRMSFAELLDWAPRAALDVATPVTTKRSNGTGSHITAPTGN